MVRFVSAVSSESTSLSLPLLENMALNDGSAGLLVRCCIVFVCVGIQKASETKCGRECQGSSPQRVEVKVKCLLRRVCGHLQLSGGLTLKPHLWGHGLVNGVYRHSSL